MQKIIVILGPTASGKTHLAINLAKKFEGYIISADSRQIYRGMDIGTDKLPEKERRGVEHRMIDIVDPNQEFSLAQYQKRVFSIIKQSDKLPFLVGGTGLYIKAVVDNLDIPKSGPDKVLRKKLEEKSNEELLKELIKLDVAAARTIDENNRRRLIRAIEVCRTTGHKFSKQTSKQKPIVNALQIGVSAPREELYQKIDRRVDEMIKEGLIEEAKKLGERYGWDIPSMSAIGYRQLGLYFQKRITLKEAVELIKKDTRNYARRQLTWFRKDERIHWIKSQPEAEKLIKNFIKKIPRA
ncbi:MAG: tRNA (adenosine(37)-N6)-dimethylallyltransferase MiaA [Candidatus Kerfeldbacteria bacterium CG_4_10_14_0_8_um_filter_42_10]|uniref:tRNA dimethylallyltransferase n=1 Tax=Candidatus Kerfeldbacteria bacterium CG_4_10_14_0_8_um_filter_42_10 TaxID=2014248 RepID=A0A2M7RFN5_9BACT|nr:MAG: tRNA (adenosine(37)-N6)-dimethylallyltransferase MiaA [Candidatus Kerfeldbacteria bacterium CG_4_10_14_0_8_um_filter_42_10]